MATVEMSDIVDANECFKFYDEFGPEKVVVVYDPTTHVKGIVVVDNVSKGPAIGGIRMTPSVTVTEVFRLARAMTWKNALAGIPHGGGKSGIIADPKNLTPAQFEHCIRYFGKAIRALPQYIPGPDMGTDETAMAWIRDENKDVIGLPKVLGGIPLDEIGATGFGLVVCAKAAEPYSGVKLDGATVSIQGFGNVGRPVAKFFAEKGAKIICVTDRDGSVYDANGLNVDTLFEVMQKSGGVTEYPGATVIKDDGFLDVECDFFVPAAQKDVITVENVNRLKCKIVLQGANIPVRLDAEAHLQKMGILSLPDILANSGGVICGAVEYSGGTETQAMTVIEDKIRHNTIEVLEKVHSKNLLPRDAALEIAQLRVREATSYRLNS
jgi:glutamate dehydrogenase/leucine dehydrogenase